MRTIQGPNGSAGGSSSTFGALSIAGGALALQAGAAIAANDLLTIDEDGLAYPVTDAACVVNPNKDQQIIATTAPVSIVPSSANVIKPIKFADGTFMVYNDDSTNARHYFSLYSRAGVLLKQVFQAYSGSNLWSRWAVLSNGNIVFATYSSSLRAMVIAPDTSTVVAYTQLEAASTVNSFTDVLPLSGGGFAIAWSLGNPAALRFAIYSNTITAVLAPTTLYTAGSNGTGYDCALRQFANGNIAIFARQGVAGQALRMGVYTSTGTAVLAFTTWAPASGDETTPTRVVVLGNYLCAAYVLSSTLKAYVINSSGVQQGTTYSLATTQSYYGMDTDGTDFLLFSMTSSGSYAQCTRLPVTGAANATMKTLNSAAVTGTIYGFGCSFIDNEWLISYGVASTRVDFNRVTLEGQTVTGGSISLAISSAGHADPLSWAPGTALITHSNGSGYPSFTVKRYRSAAIQGIAAAAASRLATVQAVAANGTYQCNPIVCNTPTNFNHNATNVIGQRGTLYPRGVAFRGLV